MLVALLVFQDWLVVHPGLFRKLRIGYSRAARIMDELENRGIVGPSKGAEPRDILIDLDGQGADGGGLSAV